MTETAQSASGAFTAGSQQMLTVMNATLEGIRENTGVGARAMSDAAADMREAAQSMREEMEGAARSGSEAAELRMREVGERAGAAINGAGQTMLTAIEGTGEKIATLSNEMLSKAGEELLAPLKSAAGELGALAEKLGEGTRAARETASNLRLGAQASAEAAGSFVTASQDLTAAAQPIRASTEQIEGAMRNLNESTRAVAASAETSARSAEQALQAAKQILGDERRAIDAAMKGVEELVRRMQGQGDKLDDIDSKLGNAFEQYAEQTENAMQAVRDHVANMSKGLNTALDTLSTIVDSLQAFTPQQRRN